MNRIHQSLVTRQLALAEHSAKGLDALTGDGPIAPRPASFCVPLTKDVGTPLVGYYDAASELQGTNGSAMSARFIVTKIPTDILDRDGDIMQPSGCLLSNYSKNSCVFFDHREMDNKPIGKCKDASGNCTVKVSESDVRCEIFFSQRTRLGNEIWNLVDEGILVAVSPGFIPVRAEKLPHSKAFANNPAAPRYNILEFDLFEISVCGVPVNPEALRIQMSRGRIRTDWLRKSLSAYAQPARTMSHGAELTPDQAEEDETPMSAPTKIKLPANVQAIAFAKSTFKKSAAVAWLKAHGLDDSLAEHTKDEWVFLLADEVTGTRTKSLAAGITATLAKAKKKAKEPDDDERDSDDAAPKKKPAKDTDEDPQVAGTEEEEEAEERADEEEKPVETKDEGAGDTSSGSLTEKENAQLLKPGAMALIDLAGHHAGVKAYLDTAVHHIEGPERVVQHLEDEAEHAGKRHDAAEKCFNKCYPQHKGEFSNLVNKPDSGEDKKPDSADKAVKAQAKAIAAAAFAKAITKATSPMKDAAEFLAELGTTEGLPASCRAGAQFHANALNSVMQSAIEQPGGPGEETVPALENNTPDTGPAAPGKKDEAPGVPGVPPTEEDEEKARKGLLGDLTGLRDLFTKAGAC